MSRPVSVPVKTSPQHARGRARFDDQFDRSPQGTMAAMSAAGDDVPNQRPSHAVRLQRMGVTRTAIPVSIVDPFDAGRSVQLGCSIAAHTALAADRRGIHVSRIGDLLARLSQELFPSLSDYAAALCERLCEAQDSDDAEVTVEGVLSYIEREIGSSARSSIEHLSLYAAARQVGGPPVLASGIGFNHLTACPCVQRTYRHSFDVEHQALIEALDGLGIPLVAHSQRCRTHICVQNVLAPIPLDALLAAADRVVVRCQNTLPRDAELLAVHRAHREPRFVEDVLRDLLAAVYELIRHEHRAAIIRIDATSLESIHDFDISGTIAYSVAELRRHL